METTLTTEGRVRSGLVHVITGNGSDALQVGEMLYGCLIRHQWIRGFVAFAGSCST